MKTVRNSILCLVIVLVAGVALGQGTYTQIDVPGAAYTLWMYKRVIFGAVANSGVASMPDLNRREFWLLALVALAVLAMGVWPKPFIDVMHVSVADLLAHVAKTKL